MSLRLAMALLLALLSPACTGWLGIARLQLKGWHAVEAGGMRLIGDLTVEEIQGLAGDLARFDAIFAELAGWHEGDSTTPLLIYLFRSREAARRFGLGLERVPAWSFVGLDESVIAIRISSGRDEDRYRLFHEYTHVLLRRKQRAPLPHWYDEGLAAYFGTVSEREGAVVVGAAPGTLAAWVTDRGALPLDRLFAASHVAKRGTERSDFCATSWALSHYLLSSPSGRRELSAYVKQLARGVPRDEAQTAAFGRSVDQLGEELAVHVAQLNRGVPIETLMDASSFAAPDLSPVVALKPGEVAYALGILALEMVDMDEVADWKTTPDLARNLLALALAEAPPDARFEAALGEARAVSGDAEDALADVHDVLARAPDDARVGLRAARVALLAAEEQAPSASSPALAEAERLFRHALALEPESASAWFGLGQTLVRMGRPDDAFAAFETARRFGWSERLDIALARLHLVRGEPERAADLLRPIAQDPHESPTQKEASELLKQTLP